MKIFEGGNVFKDQNGSILTQRINQADVNPTLAWLEMILPGLDLQNNKLGSTGLKPTSGDLDIAVDANAVSKDQLSAKLSQWATSHGFKPEDYVRRSGISVHFKTPINGTPTAGHVQTDFMFLTNVPFSKFALTAAADSRYGGSDRNVLINSMAKSMGYKLNQTSGIADRTTNAIITDDPDKIARLLLNNGSTKDNLLSVESIYAGLAKDPARDAKLTDFREYLARKGLKEPQLPVKENDVNFLARLRDRIVNQGMQPLIETKPLYQIYEQEPAAVGGQAKGIEHLEDYVFRQGAAGVDRALAIADSFYKQPTQGSVKWDGKPAVVFGRKPDTGEFVLTDDAGFVAIGYDGLFTSIAGVANNMTQRDATAAAKGNLATRMQTLLPVYQSIWPYLEAATPNNFRGYVKGDLLYSPEKPWQINAGMVEFQPNTVAYRIPVASQLGKNIAGSQVGVAVHTMYEDAGAAKQPLSGVKFNTVPGLLLIEPIYAKPVKTAGPIVKQIKTLLNQNRAAINTLFAPAELRAMKITDFAKLAIDYINRRVDPNHAAYTGNFNDLVPGFMSWLQQTQTQQKQNNILQYLRSPSSNQQALAAAFVLFELLHDLKLDLLGQLDTQVPGNEGWVFATPAGYGKAVNRFDFTARNKARNNPPSQ